MSVHVKLSVAREVTTFALQTCHLLLGDVTVYGYFYKLIISIIIINILSCNPIFMFLFFLFDLSLF